MTQKTLALAKIVCYILYKQMSSVPEWGSVPLFLMKKNTLSENGKSMSKIEAIVSELAQAVVEDLGLELWDVEYVLEAGQRYLRVYVDSPEGVNIEQCEAVSRALDPILDEKDPVPDSYIFEVSSAGAERQLKRPSDFERFMGAKVEVKLYSAVDGAKLWVGLLEGYDKGDVTVDGHRFEKKSVASVRLRMDI